MISSPEFRRNVEMQAFPVGEAQPAFMPIVLQRSPQRAMVVDRLIVSSAYLDRWELVFIGKNDENLLAACIPAGIFALPVLGTSFRLVLEPGELLQVAVHWRGALPRFPEYLPPRLAWRPKFKGAWWVSRSPVPSAEIRVTALGRPSGK